MCGEDIRVNARSGNRTEPKATVWEIHDRTCKHSNLGRIERTGDKSILQQPPGLSFGASAARQRQSNNT